MRQPDREQFKGAMKKEVDAHTLNQVWELKKRSGVPKGQMVMPSVWSMKRKRGIATREIYKWKARLNIDGFKQEEGVNFWESFAPVASWSTIRMVLILALIYRWDTRQIDFVLAYTQALVECELFMSIPRGFEVEGNEDYVLKLKTYLDKDKLEEFGTSILLRSSSKLALWQVKLMNAYSIGARVCLCSTQMIQYWQDQIPKN
jgi:hypothetical protein